MQQHGQELVGHWARQVDEEGKGERRLACKTRNQQQGLNWTGAAQHFLQDVLRMRHRELKTRELTSHAIIHILAKAQGRSAR